MDGNKCRIDERECDMDENECDLICMETSVICMETIVIHMKTIETTENSLRKAISLRKSIRQDQSTNFFLNNK